jgi:hypothetical protein
MIWLSQNWVTVAGVLVAVGTLGGALERSKTPWVARVGSVMAGAGADLLSVGRGLFGQGSAS